MRGGGGGKLNALASGGLLFTLTACCLLVLVSQATYADAKRGCANFGHSCYGGMGKRAEYASEDGGAQAVEDPALVFTGPRSMPVRYLPAQPKLSKTFEGGDNELGDYKTALGGENRMESLRIPYLKQLMRYYRNLQNIQHQQLLQQQQQQDEHGGLDGK